jgi:N-acetylated-alpha-linked acidic dipeptidase
MGALFLALAAGLFAQEVPSKEPPSRALLLELTAEPRLAGTSGGLQGAKVAARQLARAGWEVEIDEREVVLSYPRRISVEIWASVSETTPLSQRVERFDADAIPPGDVPLYNAWSASGNVRAKVVDVGYGLRADYEELAKSGVDVRGAIALARYGRAYRGVKVDLAQEHGCVGVLLFSDPAGDGGLKGEVWPEGPWKPDHEGQRGSVLPIANAPGDPSTPGFASPRPGEDSKRLSLEELTQRLPRIPCTPIGAKEAGEIQRRLEGRGPGPVEVALELDMPRQLRTIRNVIATLPASAADAPFAIAGGHRDAWVRGANDNGSGCVALVRAAEILGERARGGWTPRRTLKIALWDAEEFGLIGSTEWGEAHEAWLRERCIAYVNCDASIAGTRFGAGGSPGMLRTLRTVAERLTVPGASTTLWEDWVHRARDGRPELGLPGAGSDHAVFAHHLGIPVVEPGFGGNSGGQYHTDFDDFGMVERFLDPGFVGHELAGMFLAELLSELASTEAAFDGAEAARAFAGHARALGSESWFGAERGERLAAEFEQLALALAKNPALEGAQRFYAKFAGAKLAGRDWFRNQLWAPNVEDGYSSVTFPTLRAATPETLERELASLTAEIRALAGGGR